MATTGRPLDARRHPDPGPQPHRARLADRRPPLRPGRAGRRHRPAASAQAAGGQGPAVGDRLRGPAARRPQSRQPAGLAADRLEPGPALRAGSWPRTASCGPSWRRRREENAALGGGACHPVELAGDGRLCHPGALPRDHPVGPARRPAQAASSDWARPRATRSRSCVASALAFEQEEIASLDRFLAWFGQGEVEVKRDPAAPSNAVRVMTVHGAKGLEAPLVILADATHDPDKVGGTSPIVEVPVPGVGEIPMVRPRKDECAPIFRALIDAAKDADQEEHWRLAYVGLTRAAERLVIAGVKPKTRRAVRQLALPRHAGQCSRWALPRSRSTAGAALWCGKARARRRPPRKAGKPPLEPIVIPDWLRQPAPPEARPPRPLAPSQIAEDRDAAPPPGPEMREAARRGTLLHALFERLPGVAAADGMRWRCAGSNGRGSKRRLGAEIAGAACSADRRSGLCRPVRPGLRWPRRRSPRLCPMDGWSRARSTGFASAPSWSA